MLKLPTSSRAVQPLNLLGFFPSSKNIFHNPPIQIYKRSLGNSSFVRSLSIAVYTPRTTFTERSKLSHVYPNHDCMHRLPHISTGPQLHDICRYYSTGQRVPPTNTTSSAAQVSKPVSVTDSTKKDAGSKDLIRLLKLVKKDWRILCAALILLALSCSIGMAIPKIIGGVLDSLRNVTTDGDSKLEPDMKDIKVMGLPLQHFLIGVGFALLIGCAANFCRVVLLRILSERLVARLRSNIIKNLIHQDAEFFDNYKVGDLISRLGSDCYVVSRSVSQRISDGVKALFIGGAGIGMMISLSPQLSALLLVLAPPVIIGAKVFGKQLRQNSTQLQEATANITRVSEEQFNGIKTVQSFVAEQSEIRRYNNAIRGVFEAGKRAAFINAKFYTTTSVLGDLSFLIVLGYGSYLVLGNQLSIGDLTAFMLYTEYTGNAMFGLSGFYSELMQGAGAATRLFELTDQRPKISSTIGKQKFLPLAERGGCEIEFKDVCFSYPTRPGIQIFKNLNFKINKGENVCIVGPSGRGKSTIALLLMRYYKPTSGQILIDGQDISELNIKTLRRKIGFVQQEPMLMSGTIRENIAYGLTYEPSEEEIRSVSKRCFCHNFITRFPQTYDTMLGPRGTLLSGGQKQRIAIARALIKRPNILILDEATSALDVESESAINYTFGKLMKSKYMTIVSIAHRLSTIRRSEIVIVLGNDGSVAEMGKFKELYDNPASALSMLLNEKSSRSEPLHEPLPEPITDYQPQEGVQAQQQQVQQSERNDGESTVNYPTDEEKEKELNDADRIISIGTKDLLGNRKITTIKPLDDEPLRDVINDMSSNSKSRNIFPNQE